MLDLGTDIQYVKGVGPRKAGSLRSAGFRTVGDLLMHFPFRYEDRSRFQTISMLREGVATTVRGRVAAPRLIRTRRRGFTIFECMLSDGTGFVKAVWFNQPYLQNVMREDRDVILFGIPMPPRGRGGAGLALENPQYETVEGDDEPIHSGRIVPVYHRLDTIGTKPLRLILHHILEGLPAGSIPEILPGALLREHDLPSREESLRAAHFPPADAEVGAFNDRRSPFLRRLIYEEFFLLEIGLALRRHGRESDVKGISFRTTPEIRETLLKVLPFRLTGAQKRVLREIVEDLRSPKPMNRLLQGDVGSGKTIVALLAALIVIENGYQAALMAPTELLAEQHHRNLRPLCDRAGISCGLLTASLRGTDRSRTLALLANGSLPFVVGTHALVQEDVGWHRLGLAIVDEQHRFGVLQRATFRAKGLHPDVLVMTATPIPRTLALTVYGDLDVSAIDELPPGRLPVATVIRDETSRRKVYEFLRGEMARGRQVYVVCPLVEESEKSDLRAATEMAGQLRREFPGARIGLAHGRMGREEREETMDAFRAGAIHLLVATTVIEVGVDVPNATVMVVEHAERFGLSQLHQLRGRVGRGAERSWCILLRGKDVTPEAAARLEAIASTADGFRIAERDLEIRGPGEFFGTRQSGLPEIRIGNLVRDQALLVQAREDAFRLLRDTGGELPRPLRETVRRYWGDRFRLAEVG